MEISQRYNSVPVKDNYVLFAPTPYFWTQAIRWCHLNFSPPDHCCQDNEFSDKTDYNSAPAKDNCMLLSPIPYFRARAMQWCHVNFSPEDLCCHGNQPFLFKDKIGCRLTRASNAETQLLSYSVAMGQIPRSTERISSFKKILSDRSSCHDSTRRERENVYLSQTHSHSYNKQRKKIVRQVVRKGNAHQV